MSSLFENRVLCKDCDREMNKTFIRKNGFKLRALKCPDCDNCTIHPEDKIEYNKYKKLKKKTFKVKLRLVGNSYAVSIPKEIVRFMKEQEEMVDDMVKLAFEDMNRLRLKFA